MMSDSKQDVTELMLDMGKRAKAAANALANTDTQAKIKALLQAADQIAANEQKILAANKIDLERAKQTGLSAAFTDRLTLDSTRLADIVSSIRAIAKLDDPVGQVIDQWDVPSGLNISRVRTPIGVIGIIYESRPNVTADAAALCLMSGNGAILRGGTDSFNSARALHACFVTALKSANLSPDTIQIVPTTDRAAVGEMLKGLGGAIDVIVPRGGKGLVGRVQSEARVPVFAHLEGICHIFVDESADLKMACEIVLNSKMRRTGVCGAAETLLVHKNVANSHLVPILETLSKAGCTIHGDAAVIKAFPNAITATKEDWSTEYLSPDISVALVDDIDEAIKHIATYSSGHTEAIITENNSSRDEFFAQVDSAILLHNASTQYADGGEFGMGAEIGISTGKMHARGPVGVEQLTSFKYQVLGDGQCRP